MEITEIYFRTFLAKNSWKQRFNKISNWFHEISLRDSNSLVFPHCGRSMDSLIWKRLGDKAYLLWISMLLFITRLIWGTTGHLLPHFQCIFKEKKVNWYTLQNGEKVVCKQRITSCLRKSRFIASFLRK